MSTSRKLITRSEAIEMLSTVDSGEASSALPAKIGQVPVLVQGGGEKHAPVFFAL